MNCCLSNGVKTQKKKSGKSIHHFIIEHSKNNKENDTRTSIDFDQRRIVFISLIGAIQSWKKCPSVVLYLSIFLVPLKKEWILDPDQYPEELYTNFHHPLASVSDENGRKEFIELLRWKDSQKLVFWMNDECNFRDETLVHPFWHKFSDALINLYDPIASTKYKPLCLDSNLWKTDDIKSIYLKKCGVSASSILNEIYLLPMKFKTIQALIYESNPKSLHAVKYYGDSGITGISDNDSVSNYNEAQDWWMASDYSDYDDPQLID